MDLVVGARVARRLHEGRLGEVRPVCEALHLFRGKSLGTESHGHRVAAVGRAPEHVDLREGAPHDRRVCQRYGACVPEVLSRERLNRALLERQCLLERVERPALELVEQLVGLQAQATAPPYFGLWSRLRDFDPHELGRLLTGRQAVRLTLMRGTVHLVSVRDALFLRPLTQMVIERAHNGAFGRRMGRAEPAAIATAVHAELESEALGARELGRRLVARGIGADVEAIGNAARVALRSCSCRRAAFGAREGRPSTRRFRPGPGRSSSRTRPWTSWCSATSRPSARRR